MGRLTWLRPSDAVDRYRRAARGVSEFFFSIALLFIATGAITGSHDAMNVGIGALFVALVTGSGWAGVLIIALMVIQANGFSTVWVWAFLVLVALEVWGELGTRWKRRKEAQAE